MHPTPEELFENGCFTLKTHQMFLKFSVRHIEKRKASVSKNHRFLEKQRFRDGLVWMVGLIVEIKLRFRDFNNKVT